MKPSATTVRGMFHSKLSAGFAQKTISGCVHACMCVCFLPDN